VDERGNQQSRDFAGMKPGDEMVKINAGTDAGVDAEILRRAADDQSDARPVEFTVRRGTDRVQTPAR
jgi:hypothetical protein